MSLATLEAKYPKLFAHHAPRGGPGWVPLVDVLCEQIQARADPDGVQPIALKTRAKWGALAVRFHHLDPADQAMVHYAHALSQRICEVCGGPGRLIAEELHRTRCEEHRDVWPFWPT